MKHFSAVITVQLAAGLVAASLVFAAYAAAQNGPTLHPLASAPSTKFLLEGIVYHHLITDQAAFDTNVMFGVYCIGTDPKNEYFKSLFTNPVVRIESGTNNVLFTGKTCIDKLTGKPAKLFWCDVRSVSNGVASVRASWYTGLLSSQSYLYELKLVGTNWVIVGRRRTSTA
jgi:hypothetical protein